MTRPRIHVRKTRKRQQGRDKHRYKKTAYGAEKNNLEASFHMTTHRDGKVNRRQVLMTALTKQGTSSPRQLHGITKARVDYNQK